MALRPWMTGTPDGGLPGAGHGDNGVTLWSTGEGTGGLLSGTVRVCRIGCNIWERWVHALELEELRWSY